MRDSFCDGILFIGALAAIGAMSLVGGLIYGIVLLIQHLKWI